MNDDLGAKFWLKLIGLVIVFGIAATALKPPATTKLLKRPVEAAAQAAARPAALTFFARSPAGRRRFRPPSE